MTPTRLTLALLGALAATPATSQQPPPFPLREPAARPDTAPAAPGPATRRDRPLPKDRPGEPSREAPGGPRPDLIPSPFPPSPPSPTPQAPPPFQTSPSPPGPQPGLPVR